MVLFQALFVVGALAERDYHVGRLGEILDAWWPKGAVDGELRRSWQNNGYVWNGQAEVDHPLYEGAVRGTVGVGEDGFRAGAGADFETPFFYKGGVSGDYHFDPRSGDHTVDGHSEWDGPLLMTRQRFEGGYDHSDKMFRAGNEFQHKSPFSKGRSLQRATFDPLTGNFDFRNEQYVSNKGTIAQQMYWCATPLLQCMRGGPAGAYENRLN